MQPLTLADLQSRRAILVYFVITVVSLFFIMPSMKEKRTYFKQIQNFKADYAPAEFTQWESERTGMRVVVVDRKGPKVYGYFALATEIHDDSGARKYSFQAAMTTMLTDPSTYS